MKKIFLIIFIAVLLICGSFFSCQRYTDLKETKRQQALLEQRKAAWQALRQKLTHEINQFKGETAVVVKDLETGWEISYDKNKLFPSASLAKVPLMASCFLAADQGRIKLERNIALKSSDKLTGSGVLKNMPAGTTFSVERLVGLMIYDSDNTATNIVTNLLGLDYLNSTFKTFGLKDTELSRKIADYQLRDKGIENYTTAEDMALLLEKIYRRVLGNQYVSDQCISILKLTRLNDRIPKYLPVDLTIAHKTGLENGVCHDVGIVLTCKGNFLICVLTKHVSSSGMLAKEFIAKIALCAYQYFEGL